MKRSWGLGVLRSWGLGVLGLLLLGAGTLSAQQEVNRRHAVTPDMSIRIFGTFSSLRVIGWDVDSVAFTGAVSKGTRIDGGFGGQVGKPSPGAKFYIEAPASDAAIGKGGTLELRVPKGARVWVKSGSAAIYVSGITGGLDLNIVGGSIQVSGSPRELRAESMDGGIRIDGAPSWLRAKTATGDITLAGGGEDIGLSSVSGALRVLDGSVERLRIETVSGLVTLAARFVRGSIVDIDSHSGPVELRLAPKAGVEINAISLTGSIDNQWNGSRPIAGREGRGQELGVAGGAASARVTVRSFKGTITLRADKRLQQPRPGEVR